MTVKMLCYPVLEAEISVRGIRKKYIAEKLNITPRALSYKMSGKTDFRWQEINIIHSLFPDVPADKLFEHKITE